MGGGALVTLLAQGLCLAAIPVSLVWALRGQARFAKLASVTAFLTFDLVVFGAFTRLTDSGLGCPDWPGCFAHANPLAASSEIANAAALAPGGPVDMTKAWIEMIHRSLAMAVGVLILVVLVMSWQRRHEDARPGLALGALLMVVVQGLFGALTVTLRLYPAVVTTHLLLGLGLLGILAWQAATLNREGWILRPRRVRNWNPGDAKLSSAWRGVALFALLLLALQIALGGWVSTNYAVLACADFPTCHGQLVPHMDFKDGFEIFHPLGQTEAGRALPIEALTAIHWMHRNMAAFVLLVLGSLSARLWHSPLSRLAKTLAALLLLQACTGIANVVFGWPLLAAVLHNAGAAGLCVTLVLINFQLRHIPLAARAVASGPIRAVT